MGGGISIRLTGRDKVLALWRRCCRTFVEIYCLPIMAVRTVVVRFDMMHCASSGANTA